MNPSPFPFAETSRTCSGHHQSVVVTIPLNKVSQLLERKDAEYKSQCPPLLVPVSDHIEDLGRDGTSEQSCYEPQQLLPSVSA